MISLLLSLSNSASKNVLCCGFSNLSVCIEVFWNSALAISLSPASGISHPLRFSSVSDLLHDNISANATDPSVSSLLWLMFSFSRDVLLWSALNIRTHPSLQMLFLGALIVMSPMFSPVRVSFCTRPAAMWVTTTVSSAQLLRFNTLSVLFISSILSSAQPTTSLLPFASCQFHDKSSSSRMVLYCSVLNMLTAPVLPILLCFKSKAWTDRFSANSTECSALWSVRFRAFNFVTIPLWFIALTNFTHFSEIMSPAWYNSDTVAVLLSSVTLPTPRTFISPTLTLLRVGQVITCWRRDTA